MINQITFGPQELKGRELKEDKDGYFWVNVAFDNKNMYCKVDKDNFDLASQGSPFMAYNPWVRNMDGSFTYLPIILWFLEPMFVSRATMIAYLHYAVSKDLDKMTREAFSGIVVAKEGDVPKTPTKLIKV